MKQLKLSACIAASLLFAGACKKGNSNSIVGTWEIREAQNGMTPTITYPPGNDSLMKFTDAQYSIYSKGQMVKTGAYSIVYDPSFDALVVPTGEFTHRIIFDGNNNATKIFLQVSGNTLTFLSGSFALDYGSDTQYQRK